MSDVPVSSPLSLLTILVILTAAGGFAPGALAQTPAPRTSEGRVSRYDHTRVVPFGFRYPEDWEIWESPLGWSGRHWLLAGPRGTGPGVAPTPGRGTPRAAGALSVTLRGHQPELLFAGDRLARAEALCRDTLIRRVGTKRLRVETAETLALGGSSGRLLSFSITAADSAPATEGLALVATRGTALVFAEIRWPRAEAERYASASRRLLAGFEIPAESSWRDFRWPPAERGAARVVFRHPENWPVTPVRTPDASLAFQLESPRGREVLLRHLTLDDDLVADDALCRRLARELLVDQMKLVTKADVDDAPVLEAAGTTGGLRILAETRGILRDIRVFARRGELIVAILELPDRRAGAAFGAALRVLASFRAATSTGVAQPRLADAGTFVRPLAFVAGDLDLFDDRGRPQRPRGGRLRLDPDGSFRLFPAGLGLDRPVRGRYRVAAGSLTLTFEGGPLRLELDPSFLTLKPAEGPPLYRVPGLP